MIQKTTKSGIMRDKEKYKRLYFSGKVSVNRDDNGNARREVLTQRNVCAHFSEWGGVCVCVKVFTVFKRCHHKLQSPGFVSKSK